MSDATSPSEPTPDQREVIEEIVALLFATNQRLQQHASARAAELDLTLAQAKVLVELAPGEAVPMRVLATRLNFDASNLTGLVDRLEARGALERRPHPNDRRIKSLVLTEEGLRLREEFRRRLFDYRGTFGALTLTQLLELRDLLRKVLEKE